MSPRKIGELPLGAQTSRDRRSTRRARLRPRRWGSGGTAPRGSAAPGRRPWRDRLCDRPDGPARRKYRSRECPAPGCRRRCALPRNCGSRWRFTSSGNLTPQQLARQLLVEPDHERFDEARVGFEQRRDVHRHVRDARQHPVGRQLGQRRSTWPGESRDPRSGCNGSAPVPSATRALSRAAMVSSGSSRARNWARAGASEADPISGGGSGKLRRRRVQVAADRTRPRRGNSPACGRGPPRRRGTRTATEGAPASP